MPRLFNNSTSDSLISSIVPVTAAPLTIAGWVRLSAVGAVSRIIFSLKAAGSADLRNGFELRMNASEQLLAQSASNTTSSAATTTDTIAAGVPTHVAGVFAATNSRFAYINGVASAPGTTSVSAPTGMDTLSIGVHHESSVLAKPWLGEEWDFGLWNVGLNQNEILALANGRSPLTVRRQNLIALYAITGKYSPERDAVGRNDLTVSGAAYSPVRQLYVLRRPSRARVAAAAAGIGRGLTESRLLARRSLVA